jgi:uncharacterized protein YidB (DUF937 family)
LGAHPHTNQNKEGTMGFLDQLTGELSKKLGGGTDAGSLLEHAMSLINNPSTGGLPGLVEAFKNNGLGNIVSSWISTGKNMPISADQILQTLGPDKIQKIAQKLGMSSEDLSQHLSQLLPQIIDKLTPNGNMPNPSVLEEGLNMLKKNFLGK